MTKQEEAKQTPETEEDLTVRPDTKPKPSTKPLQFGRGTGARDALIQRSGSSNGAGLDWGRGSDSSGGLDF